MKVFKELYIFYLKINKKIYVSYQQKNSKLQNHKVSKKASNKYLDIRLFKFREIFLGCIDKNISPKTTWRIMHKRWYIENTCFHQLKTHCAKKHCFRHNPVAIEVILNIMFKAFNMFKKLHN